MVSLTQQPRRDKGAVTTDTARALIDAEKSASAAKMARLKALRAAATMAATAAHPSAESGPA